MKQIEEIYQIYLEATGISTDTRQLKAGNVFFALKGVNFNGNEYAEEALKRGAAYVIVDEKAYAHDAKSILVDDSLGTLQELARLHRSKLNIPVIGLTGTNGKTTTKELIDRVLSKKYRTHSTVGNLNNHIGVPLTLLDINEDAEIAVIEMGANHIGEIAMLCEIARPGYGLITNIGKAHLEGFGGYEGVIKAKTELYTHIDKSEGSILVNHDDELLMRLSKRLRRNTYGQNEDSDTRGVIISSIPFLNVEWENNKIVSRMYGDYNFENIMAAVAFGKMFEVKPDDICDAIAAYSPDNSRSQLLRTNSNLIYLDAYNANPSSMMASIKNFEKHEAETKVLLLGDMLELGEASEEEHQNLVEYVAHKFSKVILVGPEFMKASCPEEMAVFPDTTAAAAWVKENSPIGANILIKGSRGIALEKLLDLL